MSALLDEILEHGEEYDPIKAREYYLRTRKLKGRQKGSVDLAGSRRPGGSTVSALPRKKKAVSPALQRRRETQARINALNERLEALRKVLRELVEAAKARSGVETPKPKDSKSKAPVKKATSAGSEKLTAAQKKEAAKKAKERYEKEKDKNVSLTDQEKTVQAQVEAVKKKIVQARKDLRASIERANKRQTSKNPAAPSRRNS